MVSSTLGICRRATSALSVRARSKLTQSGHRIMSHGPSSSSLRTSWDLFPLRHWVDSATSAKWNEVFLLKEKSSAVDTVQLYNQAVVIQSGLRLERLRADKGGENAGAAFRKYCLDVGIKLEFASTNTPQQIGANERLGRTVAGMVRCLLSDSGLPPFLWGELFLTTSCLSNRAPHAALSNKTPFQALYGKPAHLGHLRAIGARAFFHIETLH